jgi:cyclohexyl-isocyanide hydratase
MLRLRLEYNTAPTFTSGSPDTAPPEVIARLRQMNPAGQERRKAANAITRQRLVSLGQDHIPSSARN